MFDESSIFKSKIVNSLEHDVKLGKILLFVLHHSIFVFGFGLQTFKQPHFFLLAKVF